MQALHPNTRFFQALNAFRLYVGAASNLVMRVGL
jgi:hypothetical protein